MLPTLPESEESRIPVVGMDPSLRNWGLAMAWLYLDSMRIQVTGVSTISPVLPTGKQVRQNSLDIESAVQLYDAANLVAKFAKAIFIEVPVGSQSARAMASYGVCTGVLGALRASGIPFFELTPTEVKLAGHGSKTATKEQMIQWAITAHPEANWPTYRRNGVETVSESRAEHMADAVAAIHAGIRCNSFKQLVPFFDKRTLQEPCKSI